MIKLPKGRLSPSQVNAYHRCGKQYEIFTVGGAKAPPDFFLAVKRQTHETILDFDLAQKVGSGKNIDDSLLVEHFRAGLEHDVPMLKEDPNLTESPDKLISEEVSYFGKIAEKTRPMREAMVPVAVEKILKGQVGSIPVEARLDVIDDEGFQKVIRDLKRRGSSPGQGHASHSLQLATYSILEGIPAVSFDTIVENKTPKVESDRGEITDGMVVRAAEIYEKTAIMISAGIFMPVDISDNRKAWICTAQFCGAWKTTATDWITGANISCPFGERSQKQ